MSDPSSSCSIHPACLTLGFATKLSPRVLLPTNKDESPPASPTRSRLIGLAGASSSSKWGPGAAAAAGQLVQHTSVEYSAVETGRESFSAVTRLAQTSRLSADSKPAAATGSGPLPPHLVVSLSVFYEYDY